MTKRHKSATKWLSTQGAAEELGVAQRTVYKFVDEGTLPGYRFGRVIRVKAADVDAFIEAQRVAPGTLAHLYPEQMGGRPRKGDRAEAGGPADRPADSSARNGGRPARSATSVTGS